MHPLATRLRPLLILALALLAAGTVRADAPRWNVQVVPDGEIFPALELSQPRARDGAGSGLVRVRISGSVPGQPLTLVIDTPGLVAPTRMAAGAGAPGTQLLEPHLDWDLAALGGMTGSR